MKQKHLRTMTTQRAQILEITGQSLLQTLTWLWSIIFFVKNWY